MIFITGATEYLGDTTIRFLLEKGARLGTIAALVSDRRRAANLLSKGIIVNIGNYDNYTSLVEAFHGVDTLVLFSGTDLEIRVKRIHNTIKAAQQSGKKHIFYIRIHHKDESPNAPLELVARMHKFTEKIIQGSGIPFTIVRNISCNTSIPFHLPNKKRSSSFPQIKAMTATTIRNYLAEATAELLMSEGHRNIEYFVPAETKISRNTMGVR